ncbi:hypothetical protein V202x_14160 [Gimesia aquarii]|uniref:Uncharacterized protein n=1 Tax=Gimesia aquarii TaxID=2527964 RepID=A0A517WS28_9PLAN|nr:hypothetical protein V202x_14160 [Gimesia aquarii]
MLLKLQIVLELGELRVFLDTAQFSATAVRFYHLESVDASLHKS